MKYVCRRLSLNDLPEFRSLMELFGEVFEDKDTYQGSRPSDDYIRDFLSDSSHIVLVAEADGQVIGGLAAYELKKFEQERSEFYIYDLAVSKNHQRKGAGTALVDTLKAIAEGYGVSVIFVQADKVDQGAVSFYRSLKAAQTETYNFDLRTKRPN